MKMINYTIQSNTLKYFDEIINFFNDQIFMH